MGRMSWGSRSRRLGRIERDILTELSFGDLLVGYLLSAGSTYRMLKIARERASYRHRRKRAIERLRTLKYIDERGGKLSITATGESAIENAAEKTLKLLKTKKWDYKWRIAIFDIPETHALLRNKVRYVLKRAGFVQLQRSVWVFPHDCEELVKLIKEESQLSEHILYGVLVRIENEGRLKKMFGL